MSALLVRKAVKMIQNNVVMVALAIIFPLDSPKSPVSSAISWPISQKFIVWSRLLRHAPPYEKSWLRACL